MGDTVIFSRRYKTLGVEKGDEREVAKVDHERNTVHLRDREGHVFEWRPYIVAATKGGVEVYRSETMELRAGDRVRFTRNDPASGLVNGQVADVDYIERLNSRIVGAMVELSPIRAGGREDGSRAVSGVVLAC